MNGDCIKKRASAQLSPNQAAEDYLDLCKIGARIQAVPYSPYLRRDKTQRLNNEHERKGKEEGP